MKIRIEEVVQLPDGIMARFSSSSGKGWARWMDAPPSIGQSYSVEFDVREDTAVIHLSRSNIPTFRITDGPADIGPYSISLNARVSELFEDVNEFAVDLGGARLQLGWKETPLVGEWLRIVTSELLMFDCHL